MSNEVIKLPPTQWSEVITAVIQHNREQGTNMLLIYSADEQLIGWSDLNAIGERAAMLEATSDLRVDGYAPVGRTWDGETNESEPVRSFRRASAKGAK